MWPKSSDKIIYWSSKELYVGESGEQKQTNRTKADRQQQKAIEWTTTIALGQLGCPKAGGFTL